MIIEAVREWLKSCPLIDDGTRFRVNYLGAESSEFTIDDIPTETVVNQYIDGSTLRQKSFMLASRQSYSGDVINNLEKSGMYDDFIEWVEEQDLTENYPDIVVGDVISVGVPSTGYIAEADVDTARYQITITIIYHKENKND